MSNEALSKIQEAYRKAVAEAQAKGEEPQIVRISQEHDVCPVCAVDSCEGDCGPNCEPIDIVSETGEVSQVAPVAKKEVQMQNQVKKTVSIPKKTYKPSRGITRTTLQNTIKLEVYSSHGVWETKKDGTRKQVFCRKPLEMARVAINEFGIEVVSLPDANGVPWLERLEAAQGN